MIISGNGVSLLGPKLTGETNTATFDFSAKTSSALVSRSVAIAWAGGAYDANPTPVLSGASSIDGLTVLQAITGGVAGAVYTITVSATDGDGATHVIVAQLMVEAAAGYATWDQFHAFVLDEAKECPVWLIDQHVRTAAKEFFRRSHAWRSARGTLFTTVASQETYQLQSQANAEVLRIHSAWLGTDELTVRDAAGEDGDEPGDTADLPTIAVEPGSIARLSPPPTTGSTAVVGTVSFIPAPWALGIPQALFDRWGREIAAHAAASLVVQPNKPWNNPAAYMRLKDCFDRAVRSASTAAGPVKRRGLRVQPV